MSMGTSEYQQKLDQMETETSAHDICNIQFTSVSTLLAKSFGIIVRSILLVINLYPKGTTGTMKGALLSHYNVVNNSYFTSKRMLMREKV